jgi:queuosine precursor transporter
MQVNRITFFYVLLMTAVVVASNVLVQYPLSGTLLGINLGDLLTYGAFTYPVAFLITDLTNRQFGPRIARRVVVAGFLVAVVFSFAVASPFNQLRRQTWWRAPLIASLFGSALDTVIFFSFAFAPAFSVFGPNDAFAIEWAPVLGVLTTEAPRWISWALGDFSVKVLVGIVMLLPYGALMSKLKPMPGVEKTA